MGNFFAELKRRHIYRVAAAYVVVAWALAQVVDLLSQVFALPSWIGQPAIIILAAGLPVTLTVAWIAEKKPQAAIADAVRSKNASVDWALFSAVAVLIALTGYQQIVQSSAVPGPLSVSVHDEAASAANGRSIAVLPFANLSGDASQEFFSDGMTEEITSALSKVPDLRIVARTSAFEFKGKYENIKSVADALGATYLIEGSVRKAGNRVRITAQLIAGQNGTHIWADDYDRELTDIFATQEDIARAIAAALRTPLGLENGKLLVPNRNIGDDDYQQFLMARALVRTRGLESLTQATKLLESVVERNPNFAPAWALMAQAYALIPVFHPAVESNVIDDLRKVVEASLPRAEAAARRSIQLDPNGADGYLSLGLVLDERGQFGLAEDLYHKALALDPNNPDGLHRQGLLQAEVGRLKEALATMQVLRVQEPFVPIYNANSASILMLNGKMEEALAMLKSLPQVSNFGLNERLAQFYAGVGQFDEALAALENLPRDVYPPGMVEAAVKLLRAASKGTQISPTDHPYLGTLGFVHFYTGMPDRILEVYDKNIAAAYLNAVVTISLWHPSLKTVRTTGHFKRIVRAAGIVAYWRQRGWPDLCHPTTADDFECN
jgi:TolB-like protein/Tfp pilus assembly protein PilF